ncbi:MAG: type II secretion system protein [Bacilli bacterium]|nr:type II secretion system protein [Bacilli bacterium]
MKNNKKGFTLVELLAVIVILAVVILIAVTAVIPRMNKAKKNAFKDEALAFIKAANEKSVLEEQGDGLCYLVNDLVGQYIDKKDMTYTGVVFRATANDEWKIEIKQSSGEKFTIKGASSTNPGLTSAEVKDLAVGSVTKDGSLNKTTCS